MALILPHHTLEAIPNILFSELRKGTVQKKHPFRNVVLSTVNKGLSKSRWVVFRKLTENHRLLIFTDARSEKVVELGENASCGLLFYHNRQGLQIRFDGTALIHQQDEWTKKYWPGVQGGGVKNYTTVLPPGSPINDKAEGNQWHEDPTDRFFNIIEFIPNRIDVLQLDRVAQIRAEFVRVAENWDGTFLVP